MKKILNSDKIGNILNKIKVNINISAFELWMIRIALWYVYIKFVINLIK